MGFGSFYLFTSIQHRRIENKITLPQNHQNQLKSFELEAGVKQIVPIEFCGLSTVRALHTIPSMTRRKNWLNAEKSNWIFKMEDKRRLVSLIKGMHLLEEDLKRGGKGDNIEREREGSKSWIQIPADHLSAPFWSAWYAELGWFVGRCDNIHNRNGLKSRGNFDRKWSSYPFCLISFGAENWLDIDILLQLEPTFRIEYLSVFPIFHWWGWWWWHGGVGEKE